MCEPSWEEIEAWRDDRDAWRRLSDNEADEELQRRYDEDHPWAIGPIGSHRPNTGPLG